MHQKGNRKKKPFISSYSTYSKCYLGARERN